MKNKGYSIFLLLSLFLLECIPALSVTPDYTVTYESTVPGNTQKAILIYRNQAGIKSRQDSTSPWTMHDGRGFQTQSQNYSIIIKRRDLKVIWRINPYEKTYSEQPLQDANPDQTANKNKTQSNKEKIGEEVFLGHQCDIFAWGEKTRTKNWIATDIPGLEIGLKTEYGEKENNVITEATQFSLAKLEDSLFEIPQGFEKVESINIATIIDNRYLQFNQKPELYSYSLDLNTIKYNIVDQKECIDVWVRTEIPQGNTTELKIKQRQKAGLPIEGYDKYGYYLTHYLITTDGNARSLCQIDYTFDGKELWKDEMGWGWEAIPPNTIGETLFKVILHIIQKNKEMVQVKS